jgi:hypothetical protein
MSKSSNWSKWSCLGDSKNILGKAGNGWRLQDLKVIRIRTA